MNSNNLKNLLDIITKQHDAFKYQAGSIIDITYFSSAPSQYLKEIKLKMNEIYILSCKISKLLIESSKLSEIYLKQKNIEKNNENETLPSSANCNLYQNLKIINNRIENEVRANYKKEKLKTSTTSLKNSFSVKSFQKEKEFVVEEQKELKQEVKMEEKQDKEEIKKNEESFQSDFMDINVSNNIFEDFYQKKSIGFKSELERSKMDNSILKDLEFEAKSSLFEDKFIENSKNSEEDKNSFFCKENSFFKQNSFHDLEGKEIKKEESKEEEEEISETFENYSSHLDNPSSSNLSRIKRIKKKRGNYNICSKELKMEAIRISRIENSKVAADLLNIPEKNIKRWLKNGPDRKKGAGRKTMDPMMEQNLLNWIAEKFRKTGELPDNKELKIQAKIFSSMDRFKASKGWCDKFLRRNNRFFQHLKEEFK